MYIFLFSLNFRFDILNVQKLPWVAGEETRRWTLVYSRPRLDIMRSVARLCWGRSMIAIMGFRTERWRKSDQIEMCPMLDADSALNIWNINTK